MNESTRRDLKSVVERAVRPVRATIARKRKMREELLAHLLAIFEEEVQRVADEQAALDQAKRRFGDTGELTRQLQQAVPRCDRARSILENLAYQPGESLWRLAARHLLVTATLYTVGTLAALPMVMAVGSRYDLAMVPGRGDGWAASGAIEAAIVLSFANAALSLIFALLVNKVGPVLVGRRWGRMALAACCVLAMPLVLSGGLAGAAVAFILMAHQTTAEWRYQNEWA
jgi:hypothetical protein